MTTRPTLQNRLTAIVFTPIRCERPDDVVALTGRHSAVTLALELSAISLTLQVPHAANETLGEEVEVAEIVCSCFLVAVVRGLNVIV